MGKIDKIDFFVGVFVSSILKSAESVPVLFEETNESKRVEFTTNSDNLNFYIKYSTKRNKTLITDKGKRKEKVYWNITFGNDEYEKIKNSRKEKYKNFVAIVCTNVELTKTWICTLDYEKAFKCLKSSLSNGNRRITVIRVGNAHEFKCQGIGFEEGDSVTCYFDYTKYFS